MNKVTHQTVPIIALASMPAEFQAYMAPLGEGGIREWADVPDEIDRSNIDIRISDLSHSYKLAVKDVATRTVAYGKGGCMNRIVSELQNARDAYLEAGRMGQASFHDEARRHLAKGTHFVVDGLTLPHLQSGKASTAMHPKFEADIGQEVGRFTDLRVTPKAYDEQPYREHRARAIAALFDFWPLFDLYGQGGSVKDRPDMVSDIVTRCVQSVADWWLTWWTAIPRPQGEANPDA